MMSRKAKEVIPNPSSIHNVLSGGTILTGNLVTGDDIRIDGTIEGNILSKGKIIIGAKGVVSGDVECHNIELMGQVTGNITCTEIVILRSQCNITGDIFTQILEIEPGAAFNGACQMQGSKKENNKKE